MLSELHRVPSSGFIRRDSAFAPLFVAHHTAICQFRVSLELASDRSPAVELVEWTTERELRRTPMKMRDPAGTSQITVIPDGAFVLRLSDGAEQPFYLEIDMGTVAPKRLRAKLRAYLALAARRLVPVLFVTQDETRRQAIARWALEEAVSLEMDPTTIWLSPAARVNEETVLTERIWRVAGVDAPQSLTAAPPACQTAGLPLAGEVRFTEVIRS